MANTRFNYGDELNDFHDAIGRIVVSSALMDDSLTGLYIEMLDSPVGNLVANGQDFARKIDACRAIQKDRDWLPDAGRMMTALDDATRLYRLRSHVVHGVWWPTDRGDTRTGYKPTRGKSRSARQDFSVRELREAANDMGALAAELWFLTLSDLRRG